MVAHLVNYPFFHPSIRYLYHLSTAKQTPLCWTTYSPFHYHFVVSGSCFSPLLLSTTFTCSLTAGVSKRSDVISACLKEEKFPAKLLENLLPVIHQESHTTDDTFNVTSRFVDCSSARWTLSLCLSLRPHSAKHSKVTPNGNSEVLTVTGWVLFCLGSPVRRGLQHTNKGDLWRAWHFHLALAS